MWGEDMSCVKFNLKLKYHLVPIPSQMFLYFSLLYNFIMGISNATSLLINHQPEHIFVVFNYIMTITSFIIVIEDALALILPFEYSNDKTRLLFERLFKFTNTILMMIQFVMFVDIWIKEPQRTFPFYLDFWNSPELDDFSTIIVKVSSLTFPFIMIYGLTRLIFVQETPNNQIVLSDIGSLI